MIESQPDVAGLSQTIVYDDVIFDQGGHSFHTPHAEVKQLVFRALPMEEQVRDGQITSDNPVHAAKVIRLPLGYPVPTHERTRIVERARHWLASQRIYIVGRFAEWSYINSDEALHRGLSLGRQLSREEADASLA